MYFYDFFQTDVLINFFISLPCRDESFHFLWRPVRALEGPWKSEGKTDFHFRSYS